MKDGCPYRKGIIIRIFRFVFLTGNDIAFIKSFKSINPLSAYPTKWSNTLKQFVDNLPTNCLSVFDYFVGLVLKGFIILFPHSGHEYYWNVHTNQVSWRHPNDPKAEITYPAAWQQPKQTEVAATDANKGGKY